MADLQLQFRPLEPQFSEGRRATAGEAFSAMRDREQLVGESSDRQAHLNDVYANLQSFITTTLRPMDPDFFSYGIEGSLRHDVPGSPISLDTWHAIEDSGQAPDEALLSQFVSELEEAGVEVPDGIRPEAVFARKEELDAALVGRVQQLDEVLGRAEGISGVAGTLGGGFVAGLDNAETLLTLPVGAASRLGILGTAAVEGTIAGLTEAATTPHRNRFLRELGLPDESILENAAFGFMVGGALGGGFKALGNLISRPQYQRDLAHAHTASPDPVVRQAARQVLRDVEDAEAAGGTVSADAVGEHRERAQVAAVAADQGVEPPLPDRPVYAEPRASIIAGQLEEVDPRTLRIEPDVFQFKSDADALGQTAKLRDVPEWRTERAGTVVVFERADGSQSIADGHQRTLLARRIMEADPAQDIRLAATVFREADGFSVEKVREIAALKNLAEAADGMTMAMARDAAKVLRVSPEAVRDLPAGPGIARARALGALSDDAFALVINDVVPDRFAALVGKLVDNPNMQMAVMRLLERTAPTTEAQAESVVRQALAAPVTREVTESLFGPEEITESLFIERARVLERAKRLLREDEQTFRVLTERGERIEGAGINRLDRGTNEEIRRRIDEALYAVDKLAYRSGPISEALDNGATAYKTSGRLKDSAGGVVDAIRAELERNGLDSAGAGVAGRPAESPRARDPAPDPNEGFADPIDGRDVDRQIAATRLDANERPAEGRARADSEPTQEGEQLLIDGVRPVTTRDRVFDADDPARFDLFDQVPVGVRDVEGEMRAETVSRADLEDELAADDEFAGALGACLT